jgi:hypothetical protein
MEGMNRYYRVENDGRYLVVYFYKGSRLPFQIGFDSDPQRQFFIAEELAGFRELDIQLRHPT